MLDSDKIVKEAKSLLVTNDLKDKIQYEVNDIVQQLIGEINNDINFQKFIDYIGYYFQGLKSENYIYEFYVFPNRQDREISIHYKENLIAKEIALVIKINNFNY